MFDPIDLSQPRARAAAFLRRQLAGERVALACQSSRPDLESYLKDACDGRGYPFAIYFVVRALRDQLDEGERRAIVERLHAEAQRGLWAWTPAIMPTSDDTAFALSALAMLGEKVNPLPLWIFHDEALGGFLTFRYSEYLGEVVTEPPSYARNWGLHPEVTANVFRALRELGFGSVVNAALLASAQRADGAWPPYFYPSPCYATAMALEVLAGSDHRTAVERAAAFLRSAQNHDGSFGTPGNPHETALALGGLLSAGGLEEEVARAARWLVSAQADDGAWPYLGPVWAYVWRDDPAIVLTAIDTESVVTTALALEALTRAEARLGGPR